MHVISHEREFKIDWSRVYFKRSNNSLIGIIVRKTLQLRWYNNDNDSNNTGSHERQITRVIQNGGNIIDTIAQEIDGLCKHFIETVCVCVRLEKERDVSGYTGGGLILLHLALAKRKKPGRHKVNEGR